MEGITGAVAAHIALTMLCQSMSGYVELVKPPWFKRPFSNLSGAYVKVITTEQANEIRDKLTACLSKDFIGASQCFREVVPQKTILLGEWQSRWLEIWASTRGGSADYIWSDKIE